MGKRREREKNMEKLKKEMFSLPLPHFFRTVAAKPAIPSTAATATTAETATTIA